MWDRSNHLIRFIPECDYTDPSHHLPHFYEWFGRKLGEVWECEAARNLQHFFCETMVHQPDAVYSIDGRILADKALHPVAMIATNAQASLASEAPLSRNAASCVKSFWETSLRKGERRYYDNCLYMFALLALSGNYRIW